MHPKYPIQLTDYQGSLFRRFTGKEKDSDSGYYYFGARYFMPNLSIWNSVDPMADKYPSMSPYNYCAWNPMKLVDPNGEEIDVSILPKSIQDRLIKCLSYITGLSLSVDDNGKLLYARNEAGDPIFEDGSVSARQDLIAAIDAKNEDGSYFVINVGIGNRNRGGKEKSSLSGIIFMSYRLQEHEDNNTNGMGMSFMHELGHAYFDDKDPEKTGSPAYNNNGDIVDSRLGDAVSRVNTYRKELGLPQRAAYFGNKEGLVPFVSIKKRKNGKTKEQIIYLPVY